MDKILIVDAETSGLKGPKMDGGDFVVEVGCVLWSLKHRGIIEAYSRVVHAQHNQAEEINGIPDGLIQDETVEKRDAAWVHVAALRAEADVVVAHNAEFDRPFFEVNEPSFETVAWVCSLEDMTWPRKTNRRDLVSLVLAHGVPVVSAHRALQDCLLLTRLFEVVEDIEARLTEGLRRAKLPRHRYVSLEPRYRNEENKKHGFRWDPDRKEWWRIMVEEDAAKLPIRVVTRPLQGQV